MTACWNTENSQIKHAKKWKEDIQHSLEQIDTQIQNYPFSAAVKTFGFRQYFMLMEKRRKLASQMEMLEDTFPPADRLVKGPNNMVFLKEGVIAVKRLKGGKEVYDWVGTFTLRKLSNESNEG